MSRSVVEIKTSNGTVFLRRDAVLSLSSNLNPAGKPIAAETIAIVTGGAAVLLHAPVPDVARALGFDRDDDPNPLHVTAMRLSKFVEDFAAKRQQIDAAVAAQLNGFTGVGDPVSDERLRELDRMADESDAWKMGKRDAA